MRRRLREIVARRRAHEIGRRRQRRHDGLAGRVLAVEHAQHVLGNPPAAVFAQIRFARGQRRPQTRGDVRLPADFAARVQPHFAVAQSPRPQQVHLQREDLGIHPRRRRLEALHAALVELALAPGLRTLAAEHRTDVVPARAVGFLRAQPRRVAHDARRAFGPQAQAPAALLEHVHFLLHHVRRLAQRTGEDRFEFHHRRAQLFEAVEFQRFPRESLEPLPQTDFGRGDVGHSLHGLVGG